MGTRAPALFLALMLAPILATGAEGPPLQSTRALIARLRAAGRAEVTVATTVEDLFGGKPRTARGRLALELPHRARLDFPDGEHLTLREDGGDWLQPRTRQLLRSGPASAEAALRWSVVLLESRSGNVLERALGGRAFELSPAGADSLQGQRQRVWLGPDGLPVRLEIGTPGGERRAYRLSGWRFARARGRTAFVLSAPAGFETVDLP
jgi:hypothetical protein